MNGKKEPYMQQLTDIDVFFRRSHLYQGADDMPGTCAPFLELDVR